MRILEYVVASGLAATCIAGCQGSASYAPEDLGKVEGAQSGAHGHALATSWTVDDERLLFPQWTGDDAKGSVFAPLFRGAFPGIEDEVYTPPDQDCTKAKGTVRVEWDKTRNSVHVVVKGKNWQPHPTVHRTEGVDYFPNPFHAAPKDLPNAGYRMWIILGSIGRTADFYYDPTTLQLEGAEFNFPDGPPQPSITVAFPVFSITGSAVFHPAEDGTVYHDYTLQYDHVTVEDGKFARMWTTFLPFDLCEAAPLQPAISQLRPYVSPWQPPSQAPTWDDMLHRAVSFDVQVEDATPQPPDIGQNLPYGFSGISFMGNMASLQGGTPNGWAFQLVSAIQEVAPQLIPVPGGNGLGCTPYLHEPHVTAPRYCEGGH